MKSITSLNAASFQAFTRALPALERGDGSKFGISVMAAKKTGNPHTVWISRPYGSKFSEFVAAVAGKELELTQGDKKLLSALWSDMNGILPVSMAGGSFRITLGKDGKPGIGFNAKASGETEEEIAA